jgi:hypothetical protein
MSKIVRVIFIVIVSSFNNSQDIYIFPSGFRPNIFPLQFLFPQVYCILRSSNIPDIMRLKILAVGMQSAASCWYLALLFDCKNGGHIFLQNMADFSTIYTHYPQKVCTNFADKRLWTEAMEFFFMICRQSIC